MGALIHMRDEPMDAPLPDRVEPYLDYDRKQMEKDAAELQEVMAWDEDTAERKALSAHLTALKGYLKARREQREERANYDNMLAQVEAWEPPTDDHVGLKEFMTEQLEKSKDFDTGYYEDPERRPKRMTGEEFKAQRLEGLARDIGYHTEHLFGEIDRAAERTEWIQQLNASLEEWQPGQVVAAQ